MPNEPNRDRVIADTGWGIKPDDQPSNASEAAGRAANFFKYDANEHDIVRKIILAQRKAFNTANRVRIEGGATGRTIIFDINKDGLIIEGLTFGDANLVPLLQRLGAAFDPQQLQQIPHGTDTSRAFDLSRAWAWGAERASG